MLRNRSRVVTKQSSTTPMMQDHQASNNSSSISPKPTHSPTTRSILQRIISPTSILDTHKHLTSFGGNPFQFTKNPEKTLNGFDQKNQKIKNLDIEGIAIILVQESKNSNVFNKPNAKKLKVQIPSDPFSLTGSPKGDFGIRTRNLFTPGDLTPVRGVRSPGYVTGPLSIKEMELSEEYTRVICHGPNPKTTHIYDNCVVDSCCGIRVGSPPPLVALESGLSSCQSCKKKIGDGCDIFMYRGEKAFCSEECRCQEMILDGLMST